MRSERLKFMEIRYLLVGLAVGWSCLGLAGVRADAGPASAALSASNGVVPGLAEPYSGVPLVDFEGWADHPRRDVTVVGPHARIRTTTIGTLAAP